MEYLDATRALEAMADLNIEHCEEPIPYWNRIDQIRLTSESSIPIMADESAFHHHDTYQILADGAADMINIKLGKAGGICNAMKIGGITEGADVYCQVGSFSESRIGISALVHFSLAWQNIVHYDLDSPLMLSEDPVQGGMKYHDDWSVTVDDSNGHGAEIDPLFLKRFDGIVIS